MSNLSLRTSLVLLTYSAYALATALPIINTSLGAVQGELSSHKNGAATVYKGIPFAAPPTGSLRWQAPQPATPWPDVLHATEFGVQCPQGNIGANLFGTGKTDIREDCLYMNIWTPTYHDITDISAKQLPVYFWIYGGRFEAGSGDTITYDGTGLAVKDIIVVTFNYRLGPFGFLAHPELSVESGHNSSGNYGLLDQVAALEWVYENIAQFGGNPNQITVGGQSAGAASSLDMIYSPLTRNLVAGVISESGARGPHDPQIGTLAESYRLKEAAEKQGIAFQQQLNASSITMLRDISMETLLDYANLVDTIFDGTIFENMTAIFSEPPLWRPVLDGYVLPQSYGESLRTGDHADVPVLTGNNKDESGASTDPNLTVASYEVYGQMFPNQSTQFFALYPGLNEADQSSNTFFQDLSRVSTWNWVQNWISGGAQSSVYVYYWTHTPPDDSSAGAYHGSEMWYTFNNLPYSDWYSNVSWSATDYEIEEKMSNYWANFIKTGSPNSADMVYFPPTTKDKQTMWLGDSWGSNYLSLSDTRIAFIEEWLSSLPEW